MAENGLVADAGISDKETEKWLSDYFGGPVKLRSCTAEKIGVGQGFTATICRLLLEYDGPRGSLPRSVVLKVPSRAAIKKTYKKLIMNKEADVEEEIESHIIGHGVECMAYDVLSKHSPIPLPVVYAAVPCENGKMGAILMEDLSNKASTLGDPTCTLPLEHLYEVADVMANFHAWCVTTDMDWRRYFDPAGSDHQTQAYHDKEFEIMSLCFQVFSAAAESAGIQTGFCGAYHFFLITERHPTTPKVQRASVVHAHASDIQRVKANYPNVFDNMDMQKAKKIFGGSGMLSMLEKHSTIIPEVLVHGDLYADNLMFEKKTDKAGDVKVGPKLVAIIDWPMAHRGCGIKDFATLMSFSADKSTRRQHTRDILRRYYNRLVKKAGSDKVKVSFDELVQVYDDQFVIAGMAFVFMLDWWQRLFVGDEEQDRKQVLFQRSVDVYEEVLPLFEKCNVQYL